MLVGDTTYFTFVQFPVFDCGLVHFGLGPFIVLDLTSRMAELLHFKTASVQRPIQHPLTTPWTETQNPVT
jgi:hypothetical protein